MPHELTCHSPIIHPHSTVENYLAEIKGLAALTSYVMLDQGTHPDQIEDGLHFVQQRIEDLATALANSLPVEIINFEPAQEKGTP